ncbi:hypothetical protein E4U22_007099 [Claviceps purpurea]|nr:hypothetical protein E4U25_003996 [Claviceps purpurea]KAG6308570.1 hypothetical protein E4U45_000427 [Claviceps purpurea]KAG6323102.1 hypothetical protein E4U22_007099 [Claviceps purpurea]
MVKILSMFMTTLATVGPIVQAGPCTPGLKYCGFTLKNYDYPGAENLKENTLYICNSNGSVTRSGLCPIGCSHEGAGKSDSCKWHWLI